MGAAGLPGEDGGVAVAGAFADPAKVDPLAQAAADAGIGALRVDHPGAVAEAILLAADAQLDAVALHAGDHLEAAVDVAVLGVLARVAVVVAAVAGQRHALADHDLRRVAFGGLDLLQRAVAAAAAAVDDAHLVTAMTLAAAADDLDVAGVDAAVDPVALAAGAALLLAVHADQ
ncbi:hypothetical protein D3C77_593760 [compost metagenome]